MIEYTLFNLFILKLKVYCVLDKFYGRSKFGQDDKEKNRAPLSRPELFTSYLDLDDT